MSYEGDFPVGGIVRVSWNTQDATETPVTPTDAGITRIYKNSSETPRSSTNGVTEIIDFGDVVGSHEITIDTTDNSDAGFYAAGGEYMVTKVGVIVDDTTVNATLARFSIERTGGALATVKSSAFRDAVADAIHDEVVEGTLTLRHSLRIANAANAGKLSGAASGTPTIRDPADTKNRISAVTDANGNRSSVVTDVT